MIGPPRARCLQTGAWSMAPFCTHVSVCPSLQCERQQSGAIAVTQKLVQPSERRSAADAMPHHRCSWDAAAKSCICICWKQQRAPLAPAATTTTLNPEEAWTPGLHHVTAHDNV